MYDDVLRSNATDLSSSESSVAGVDVGVDLVPRTLMVHVPTSPTGTTPTLDVKIQESDNNSTWRDLGVFPQINAAGQYFITLKSNARYRRYVATLGGTTPNFGKTLIAYVPAGEYTNW